MSDYHTAINVLLIGGFAVTAYDTFKNYNLWAAFSMCVSLAVLFVIN